MRYFSLSFVILLVCGCTTTYEFIEPSTGKKFWTEKQYAETQNIVKSDSSSLIELKERIVWKIDLGGSHGSVEQGLLPGNYKPVFGNSLGQFYFGSERPFYQCIEGQKCRLYIGGFWLPYSAERPAKLFFAVQGGENFEVEDIEDAGNEAKSSLETNDLGSPLIGLILQLSTPSFIIVQRQDQEFDERLLRTINSAKTN